MANFNLIYKEDGLQGIIPYGFGMDGYGYRFLCDKLKEGETFYVIASPSTTMPYYFVDNKHVYFNIYTTEELANARSDKSAMDKHYVIIALMETKGWAPALWRRYRDLGVSHIRIDDAVWISIKDLTATTTYEGILNLSTPLRNPTLNSVMYFYQQHYEAGTCTDALAALYWETLKKSLFYAPIRPTRPIRSGETLNKQNSDFHISELEDGRKAILLFTDDEFKIIYGETYEMKPEEYKVVNVFSYDDIQKYMQTHKNMCALINHMMGNFLVSLEMIDEFEAISLNNAARAKSSSSKSCSIGAMTHFFKDNPF